MSSRQLDDFAHLRDNPEPQVNDKTSISSRSKSRKSSIDSQQHHSEDSAHGQSNTLQQNVDVGPRSQQEEASGAHTTHPLKIDDSNFEIINSGVKESNGLSAPSDYIQFVKSGDLETGVYPIQSNIFDSDPPILTSSTGFYVKPSEGKADMNQGDQQEDGLFDKLHQKDEKQKQAAEAKMKEEATEQYQLNIEGSKVMVEPLPQNEPSHQTQQFQQLQNQHQQQPRQPEQSNQAPLEIPLGSQVEKEKEPDQLHQNQPIPRQEQVPPAQQMYNEQPNIPHQPAASEPEPQIRNNQMPAEIVPPSTDIIYTSPITQTNDSMRPPTVTTNGPESPSRQVSADNMHIPSSTTQRQIPKQSQRMKESESCKCSLM